MKSTTECWLWEGSVVYKLIAIVDYCERKETSSSTFQAIYCRITSTLVFNEEKVTGSPIIIAMSLLEVTHSSGIDVKQEIERRLLFYYVPLYCIIRHAATKGNKLKNQNTYCQFAVTSVEHFKSRLHVTLSVPSIFLRWIHSEHLFI